MARNLEQEIDRLGLLRQASPGEAAGALRKALRDRANLLVAKAARLAGEMELRDLQPDLLNAFGRLFGDASRDPQCWGKNAVAAALRDLGYAEPEPYLRGVRHVQMEPVWGRTVDTAPALRGICLLALIPCMGLPRAEVMRHLVDGLADESHTVRVEAVRGLERMGGEESALLLRLKARLGDAEAVVVGQVFDSLLQLECDRGVRLVGEFLQSGEAREEAALALGNSRRPAAVDVLREVWETSPAAVEFRQVLLRALSISRQQSALEHLAVLVREGRTSDARAALDALSLHRDSPEIRRLAEAAVLEDRPELEAHFRALFDSGTP